MQWWRNRAGKALVKGGPGTGGDPTAKDKINFFTSKYIFNSHCLNRGSNSNILRAGLQTVCATTVYMYLFSL